MMPDYEYYALNFKGTVIDSEVKFNSVIVEATAFVDSMIGNRKNLEYGSVMIKYQNAVCAVAEEIYKQNTFDEGQQKQSESVGNHSVSYCAVSKSFAEREQIKQRRARMFLAGTGLLYRGIG